MPKIGDFLVAQQLVIQAGVNEDAFRLTQVPKNEAPSKKFMNKGLHLAQYIDVQDPDSGKRKAMGIGQHPAIIALKTKK